MKLRPKGIFCLEGDWSNDLRAHSSVEPLLSVIDQRLTTQRRHIHRDIGTLPELRYYLSKWTQGRYARYPILYLGFHGDRGGIRVGDGRQPENDVTLDWLANELSGACERKIIHFTSCRTLDLNGSRITNFLLKTGALAVSGYEWRWIGSPPQPSNSSCLRNFNTEL